jgi:small subunit ribosomal protein S4
MGDPKISRRVWARPSHPWVGERIKAEAALVRKYGLKNKQEVWKAAGRLRAWRTQARELQARIQRLEKQAQLERDLLIAKLTRLGVLTEGQTLDDVLALNLELVLTRRFQSQVYLKGLAKTTSHARQLIVHGHLAVSGRKVTVPGYLLRRGEEDAISYYSLSPLTDSAHVMRPPADFKPILEDIKIEEEEPQRRGAFGGRGGGSAGGRRIRVHAPVPADQADETVGPAIPEEKAKDITELAPEGAVEEAKAIGPEAVRAPTPAKPAAAKDDKAKKPKGGA